MPVFQMGKWRPMAKSSGSYGPTGELLASWWPAFLGPPILSQATGKLRGMQGWPLTQAGGLGSPSWGVQEPLAMQSLPLRTVQRRQEQGQQQGPGRLVLAQPQMGGPEVRTVTGFQKHSQSRAGRAAD